MCRLIANKLGASSDGGIGPRTDVIAFLCARIFVIEFRVELLLTENYSSLPGLESNRRKSKDQVLQIFLAWCLAENGGKMIADAFARLAWHIISSRSYTTVIMCSSVCCSLQ